MDHKIKLLFIIPSLAGGGAERTLINLLNKIDYDSFDVDLVCVLGKGPYLTQVPSKVNLIVLTKNEFWLKIITKIHQKFNFIQVFKPMMIPISERHYDVGISFLDSVYTDLLYAGTQFGRRFTWVHASYKSYINFYKFYRNENYRKRLIRNRFSKLDGFVFVSHDSMAEFIELFGEYPNMQVIYNPVDKLGIIKKSEHPVDLSDYNHTFNFVALGSLIPVKGYDLLLDAIRILSTGNQNFKVHILGSGYLEKELKVRANKLRINEFVNFLGFQSNPYPYLKAADAFIMTSISEALPMALCEAMVLHKPVIVTNCSGCREIVDNGVYGLMADQNPDAVAEKMKLFLTDNQLLRHYRAQSVKRAEIFNDDNMLNAFYTLINNHETSTNQLYSQLR